MVLCYAIWTVLEFCHGEGFRSMKSDALQGQSSLRNVFSIQCNGIHFSRPDPFSRNPALFIDLNPAVAPTFPIDLSAYLSDFRPNAKAFGYNADWTLSVAGSLRDSEPPGCTAGLSL